MPEQDSKHDFQSKLHELQSQENSYLKSLHLKSEEISTLKSRIKSLESLLLQREGQIAHLIREKESFFKAEEQMQQTLQEIMKENQELKEMAEMVEIERDQMQSELKESLNVIERLRKTVKTKEELIWELSNKKADLEKEIESATSREFFKSGFESAGSPQKFGFTDRKDGNFKEVCFEGMKIVGVGSVKDFYAKLIHLRQSHSKYKKMRKLVDRVSDMIVQCSPSGTFEKEPTIHQIWKWITSLVEDYMRIKKSVEMDNLQKLMKITGAKDYDEMVYKVANNFKTKLNV